MKLYEINAELETILEEVRQQEEETGEIAADAFARISELNIERNDKLEALACVIKNKKATAKALKEEEDNFKARRIREEKDIERLEKYLEMNMNNDEKLETTRAKIWFRHSMKVNIIDESKIPKLYQRIKTEPDRVAIKHAIDEGRKVRGAELIDNYSLQIK